MRLNILIAVIVGVLTYSATIFFDRLSPPSNVPEQAVAVESQTVPDFMFTSLGGQTHTMRDFEGKIVLLNFWASWCAPCIEEFPRLLKIAENYKDDLVFIALSSDHDKAAMTRFIDKMKKNHGTIMEANNVFIAMDDQNITQNIFQTYRLPETILIDSTQKLRHKLVGNNWTPEELSKLIKDL